MDIFNNAIFKSKLKDIKFNKTPAIIGCIIGCILLKPDYVYAKDTVQESTEVISFLCTLVPPTLLTAAEIYKVRASIKIYMKNVKLIMRKNGNQLNH